MRRIAPNASQASPNSHADHEPGDAAYDCEWNLHHGGAVVAWCELSDGQFRAARQPSGMLNRVDVASTLDDIATTLDEIKEEHCSVDPDTFDQMRRSIERATDAIDRMETSAQSRPLHGVGPRMNDTDRACEPVISNGGGQNMSRTLKDVRRIAAEVASHENLPLEVVAATPIGGESTYAEVLLVVRGCQIEPSRVMIGVSRQ
jgi:hypothetical protein